MLVRSTLPLNAKNMYMCEVAVSTAISGFTYSINFIRNHIKGNHENEQHSPFHTRAGGGQHFHQHHLISYC